MRHVPLKSRPTLIPLLITLIALSLILACNGTTPPTRAPATQAPATQAPATKEQTSGTPSSPEPLSPTVATPDNMEVPGDTGDISTPQPTEPPSTIVRFAPDLTPQSEAPDPRPTTPPEPHKDSEHQTYLEDAHRPPGATVAAHTAGTADQLKIHTSVASEHPPPMEESKSSDDTVERSDPPVAGVHLYGYHEYSPRRPKGRYHGQPTAPQAGEINDNDDWNTYLEYEAAYSGPSISRTALRERYVITVTDTHGLPVHGATVIVEAEDGTDHRTYRTHADGRALHHHVQPLQQPQFNPQEVLVFTAIKGDVTAHTQTTRTPNGTNINIGMPEPQNTQGQTKVDVLFLLDSTGSMSDEIDRIKQTLTSIAERVRDLPGNPDLRMGMVSYRDRGDEYVNRLYDFDSDDRRFSRTVRGVRADGGGDYPEALTEALHVAVTKPTWRNHSVKLMFLIADAPPQDYDNQLEYTTELARAQEDGIKIFAVASSGLDQQGEFIFRQFAQQTMGRFIFILYDDGPQGELTTPHEVGDDFTVERLDRLIVRLITTELQSMNTPTEPEAGQN